MEKGQRIEKDSLGEVAVPVDKYWGAQTQRSLQNFKIGKEKMPKVVIKSLAIVKYCAARANCDLGLMSEEKSKIIQQVAKEIIDGNLKGNFPLSVWQTGSGTQSNMNMNEVISNRAIELLGGVIGSKTPIHPNDDVNKSQSSNDTFPTAMNLATILASKDKLMPAIETLLIELEKKSIIFKDIVKVGRTHYQDATPLTLGQEFSGYVAQVRGSYERIKIAQEELYYLAQGATAVGTGINCPESFPEIFAKNVAEFTGYNFKSAKNKFAAIASHNDLENFGSTLSNLAVVLLKIANDLRFLSCGPRSGIAEISLPANEPGSSIMPGKVNPTQIESITMVCYQVIGLKQAITMGDFSGHLELNVYKPLIINNIITMIGLLSDSINSFVVNCLEGIEVNSNKISKLMEQSLMLVTALNKHIGYDKAAEIAKLAFKEETTLKDAALRLGYVSSSNFDKWMDPKNMV